MSALTHEEAVRISNGGQGAVVCELLRLSGKLEVELAHVKKLQGDVVDLADSVDAKRRALSDCLTVLELRCGDMPGQTVAETHGGRLVVEGARKVLGKLQ